VHALRHVHRLLVPGGALLDLHPVTEEQVEAGGRTIGVIEEPQFVQRDLPNAEACLRDVIWDGLYVLEAETEFDFLGHFDDAEELIEKNEGDLATQRALVRRIRAATPPFVTRAHVVLRRLRAV
jgi:hypothetical protein